MICSYSVKLLPEIISVSWVGDLCSSNWWWVVPIIVVLYYFVLIKFIDIKRWYNHQGNIKDDQKRREKVNKIDCFLKSASYAGLGNGFTWELDDSVFFIRKSTVRDSVGDEVFTQVQLSEPEEGEIMSNDTLGDSSGQSNLETTETDKLLKILRNSKKIEGGNSLSDKSLYDYIFDLLRSSSLRLDVEVRADGMKSIKFDELNASDLDIQATKLYFNLTYSSS